MIAAKTMIGKQGVLIQVDNSDIAILGAQKGRKTALTSIETDLEDAYDRVKGVITNIAADFADRFKEIVNSGHGLEMEFSVGLSAKTGLIFIGAEGQAAFKVKMTWERAKA
jgi:hypothetical protein